MFVQCFDLLMESKCEIEHSYNFHDVKVIFSLAADCLNRRNPIVGMRFFSSALFSVISFNSKIKAARVNRNRQPAKWCFSLVIYVSPIFTCILRAYKWQTRKWWKWQKPKVTKWRKPINVRKQTFVVSCARYAQYNPLYMSISFIYYLFLIKQGCTCASYMDAITNQSPHTCQPRLFFFILFFSSLFRFSTADTLSFGIRCCCWLWLT